MLRPNNEHLKKILQRFRNRNQSIIIIGLGITITTKLWLLSKGPQRLPPTCYSGHPLQPNCTMITLACKIFICSDTVHKVNQNVSNLCLVTLKKNWKVFSSLESFGLVSLLLTFGEALYTSFDFHIFTLKQSSNMTLSIYSRI